MAVSTENLPEIRNQRCVRYRFRYSACSRCADSCPPGALTPGEEGVELDVARCSGCGLCQSACPAAAFHLPSFPISALAKPVEKQLAIACKPSGLAGDVLIPCLGEVDAALLASLAMRGIALTLRGTGHCAECTHAPQGGEHVEALLVAIQELDDATPAKWTVPTVEQRQSGPGFRADRRQLFRRFSNRAVESIRNETDKGEVIPERAIRAAAHFVPPRRQLAERLLERLDVLPDESLLPLLFGVAVVEQGDGHCTGCDACARVCPTGAMKVSEIESQWTLHFRSGQCVGCGVCIEACGAEALTLRQRWQRAGDNPTVLHELRRYRCQGCGRYFIGLEEDSCPVCQDDEESFATIFG